jgi:hypothetical protein
VNRQHGGVVLLRLATFHAESLCSCTCRFSLKQTSLIKLIVLSVDVHSGQCGCTGSPSLLGPYCAHAQVWAIDVFALE